MAKRTIDCPECGEKCTVTSQSTTPIQCCPFCSNTILAEPETDGDDEYDDDDLNEFDPDDE